MKVTLIHGQNHQGSSCHIGRMVAEGLSAPEERTEFFLPRDCNHFCSGCGLCLKDETACPYYPEKEQILKAIDQSDLLIFTTPTYCLHASAPMKSFLDLTFTNWMVHRPKASMFSKKALVISTAAGSGAKSACKDVATALTYWGIPYVKSYGIAVQSMGWEGIPQKKKQQIGSDVQKITAHLQKNSRPRVGIKTRFLFSMMRLMQASGWGSSPEEKEYWEHMGWLGSRRPWSPA